MPCWPPATTWLGAASCSPTLATVFVGAVGGVLRILPGISDTDPWIGVSLVTLAMVLAAYAVFAQGLFMSADVAGRAFNYTLLLGFGVTAFVALLVGLERATQSLLHVDLPIVTGLALVVTIALLGPMTDRIRAALRSRSPRERAYDRLLRALGEELLTAQRPEGAVTPALARLVRLFRLEGASVIGRRWHRAGRSTATVVPDAPLALRLPLRTRTQPVGTAVFGPKRNAAAVHRPGGGAPARWRPVTWPPRCAWPSSTTQQAAMLEHLSAERRAVESRGRS